MCGLPFAELFKLGDYFGEEDLKRRCEQQLKLLITVENFSQIYMAASLHNSKVTNGRIFIGDIKLLKNLCAPLYSALQTLHDIALDLGVPNLCGVVKTDGYKSMPEELQDRLIQELPEENGLVRLERKRAKYSV